MPVWINHDSKKAVIARFKCGSSSVGNTLNITPGWTEYNFPMLENRSRDDDYFLLKNTGIDIKLGWDVFFVARDPVAYTVSGYKFVYDQYVTNYEFAKANLNKYAKDNYSFGDHVNIISDVFVHTQLRHWPNYNIFLTHCVSMPINHWRPWMNLIKIEDDFDKLHSYIGIETPFPHINENCIYNNVSKMYNDKIVVDDHTINQLKSRWTYTANKWNYNLDESIEKLKEQYLNK